MTSRRTVRLLSITGLLILALVAAALSFAALTQNRAPILAGPSPTTAPSISPTEASPSQSPVASPSSSPTLVPSASATASDAAASVVVIGDRNSSSGTSGLWIDRVATELSWDPVVNLSAAGRGYIRAPSACNQSVCVSFPGSLGLVAAENPDVVVTFGGAADGDNDLSSTATEYFEALREELPDALLVAVSPVTSGEQAPYFLMLHTRTIRTAVESVGGIFVDVGQPGLGDGEVLSPLAQDEVAQAIIDELS